MSNIEDYSDLGDVITLSVCRCSLNGSRSPSLDGYFKIQEFLKKQKSSRKPTRQERSERGVRCHDPIRKAHPRMLVRGTAQSPNIDEFALLLQPTKDTRRNYRGIAGKLIQL
jgi:hypothetical protein